MSRTLKRPMFRGGGKVNSIGTGITSGLADREQYALGGSVGSFYPRTSVPTIQDVIERGYGSVGAYLAGNKAKQAAAEEVARAENLYNKLGYVPVIDSLPTLPYEPTGKPYQGQRSFRSMNEPKVYTGETTPTETTDDTTDDTTSAASSVRKAEDESMEKYNKTKIEEDINDIKLQDFEDEITRKAEIYQKLLGGKDEKTQAFFRGLTAGGVKALEGDISAGLEKFSEEIGTADDLSTKAKLLAIQEKIQKDSEKTPTKSQEVDILANRYMQNGMNRADAYAAAEKKVYGDEKTSELPGPSKERELYELTLNFQKSEDDLIQQNPSGFAQAEMYKREGIKIIPYEPFYNQASQTQDYKATITDEDIENGSFYFDPVTFKFKYRTKAGESGFTYSLEEARKKTS